MAHVASNTHTVGSSGPLMDRLTHAVIKETSKNLRYYIDVKHRENAFVLNPNSTAIVDAAPLRARFLCGKSKGYSTFYGSSFNKTNFQQILPNYQQKPTVLISPEKQMCREELNFHMRSYRFFPKEHPKIPDSRLQAIQRSHSACGTMQTARQRSTLKLTRHTKDQLVDDAANLLANMVKTRQTIHETTSSIRQSPLMYITRSLDPSPRQYGDSQNRLRSAQNSLSNPTTESRAFTLSQMSNESRRSKENSIPSAISKMSKAKPITKGFLCQYKVSVTTGNRNGASTDAPIRIKFYGKNGCTDFHELMESETHRIPFVKGETDVFTVQTYHVGELFGITIGHDRPDMRSSWYLNNVTIDDTVTDTIYEIACNAWLSIKSYDQKTMRDLPVTSSILKKQKNDSDEHIDDNRSQSDFSTTITEGTVTLNKSHDDDENNSIVELPLKKITRKKQHVSIGPTFIAKKPTMITANASDLSRNSPPATITIEQRLRPNDFGPVTIPVRRFNSPALSTTSSDTELKGTMANGTDSTPTPTPTLNPIGLQSIREDEKVRKSSKRSTIEFERPPTRLDQRCSSVSISSERPVRNKIKTKN